MKVLDKRLFLARTILKTLKAENVRYTTLLKTTIRTIGTPRSFHSMMKWLIKYGYITHPEKGVYEITKQGQDLLKSLPNFDTYYRRKKK